LISVDGILLGVVVIGFLVATPIGMAMVGLLLWASARNSRGRRRAS